MRRIANYQIQKETFEQMMEAGRHNRALEITFQDRSGTHTHMLSAGYQDDIYPYREGDETYILTKNVNLGYIGLEVFHGEDKLSDIFIEEWNVEDTVGRFDLAPFTIIRRLLPYLTN